MPDARYPIEMVNGVPAVAAPAEIDASNAGWLREVLLEAAARGHATFVVDMTRTRFCDSAGLGVLVRAHNRALADGGELRLVIPASAAVLRARGHRHRPRYPQVPQPVRGRGTGTSHRPRPPPDPGTSTSTG